MELRVGTRIRVQLHKGVENSPRWLIGEVAVLVYACDYKRVCLFVVVYVCITIYEYEYVCVLQNVGIIELASKENLPACFIFTGTGCG